MVCGHSHTFRLYRCDEPNGLSLGTSEAARRLLPSGPFHLEGGLRLSCRNSLDGDAAALEMSIVCKFSVLALTLAHG